ncbi:MAG: ATP-binding protein [Candidatus Sumerlaeia bacterium]|nr:ATP-binding protein [Candidatus Sumerlaeia bacterium]
MSTEGSSSWRRRLGRGSLRRRVLLVVLAVGLVPALLVTLFAAATSYRTVVGTVRGQGIDRSREVSQEFDTQLARLGEALRFALAAPGLMRELRSPVAGRPDLDEAMAQVHARLAGTLFEDARVYFVERTGLVTGYMEGGAFRALDEYPAELASTPYAALLAGGLEFEGRDTVAVEGRPFAGRAGLWLLGRIPAAVDTEQRFAAVRVPAEAIFAAIETAGGFERRRFTVFSTGLGTVHASVGEPPAEQIGALLDPFPNPSGALSDTGLQGIEFAYSRMVRPLALSPRGGEPVLWTVLHPVDLGDTMANFQREIWLQILLGLGAAFGIWGFGVYAANRLVDPILELTKGVEQIAGGELDQRVELATGDELEELATSVNTMAMTLSESYARLADKLLQLDEKARQLALLRRIGQSVGRSLDMAELFEVFAREVNDLIPVELVALALPEGDGLRVAHAAPDDPSALGAGTRLSLEHSRAGEALAAAQPVAHLLRRPGQYDEEAALAGSNCMSICAIPLFTASGVEGVLLLSDASAGRFNRGEVEFLAQLAQTLALAVEHSRLFTRVSNFAAELERQVAERTRDLREAQDQLVQAERFAATGKIASDLAHEINNPLSIIKNYLAIVQQQMRLQRNRGEEQELTLENIEVIGEEIDRIARIVAQLRQLAKPQMQAAPRAVRVNTEVANLADIFRAPFQKRGVALELGLDESLGDARILSDQFRQIVLNLLNNAADAIEPKGKGRVLLSTRRLGGEPPRFSVSVEDDGTGIPEEIQQRIFDPFFTTKKEGKGTGLGLSVSYSLAQRLGGTLRCQSTPGVGTVMTLAIPLESPEGAPGDPEEEAGGAPRRSGGKTILG